MYKLRSKETLRVKGQVIKVHVTTLKTLKSGMQRCINYPQNISNWSSALNLSIRDQINSKKRINELRENTQLVLIKEFK
jgi:hypothetical protein